LYMAEIENKLRNREIREVGISKIIIRIWNLVYVNDIVLIVNNRETIQNDSIVFIKFLKGN